MRTPIVGLHHVTAIASDPQRNLDFYTQVLGLRFVKRTVNFDDPETYHFYFGETSVPLVLSSPSSPGPVRLRVGAAQVRPSPRRFPSPSAPCLTGASV